MVRHKLRAVLPNRLATLVPGPTEYYELRFRLEGEGGPMSWDNLCDEVRDLREYSGDFPVRSKTPHNRERIQQAVKYRSFDGYVRCVAMRKGIMLDTVWTIRVYPGPWADPFNPAG